MTRTGSVCIVFCSILVTLAVLEVAAYGYLNYVADVDQFRRYASLAQLQESGELTRTKLSPHRYLGHYPTPKFAEDANRHNSLGYRGDEFPRIKPVGEYRIVCVGGSTTYTSAVEDYRKSYPALLERELQKLGHIDVKVINAGTGGGRTFETLANLQFRLLEISPDLIIVYHGVNDVMARFVWPPNFYRGDNSGFLKARRTRRSMVPIWEHSALVRILLVSGGLIQPHASLDRTLQSVNKRSFHGRLFGRQFNSGRYPEGIFEKISAMKMLEVNKPIYFRNNLESLLVIAKLHDIDVMFATFARANEWPDRAARNSPEYAFGLDQHNAILRRLARKHSAWFYDFERAFPGTADYFSDPIHVNEKGSALKAQLFARYVSEQILSGR